jgi:hypothetical protein
VLACIKIRRRQQVIPWLCEEESGSIRHRAAPSACVYVCVHKQLNKDGGSRWKAEIFGSERAPVLGGPRSVHRTHKPCVCKDCVISDAGSGVCCTIAALLCSKLFQFDGARSHTGLDSPAKLSELVRTAVQVQCSCLPHCVSLMRGGLTRCRTRLARWTRRRWVFPPRSCRRKVPV